MFNGYVLLLGHPDYFDIWHLATQFRSLPENPILTCMCSLATSVSEAKLMSQIPDVGKCSHLDADLVSTGSVN